MSDGSVCINCPHYREQHNIVKDGGNAIVTFCLMCGCLQYFDAPENSILADAIETLTKEQADL